MLQATLGFTASQYEPLAFYGWEYTAGFTALGFMIIAFCVMFIPLVALITHCYHGGWTVSRLCTLAARTCMLYYWSAVAGALVLVLLLVHYYPDK